MAKTLLKKFLPTIIGLAAAVSLVMVGGIVSKNQRLTNVQFEKYCFKDIYIMRSKSEANRGYLTGRRDSTIRRSRSNFPGSTRELIAAEKEKSPGSANLWLLKSKKYGTVFFIPVEKVPDWRYPFLYHFIVEESGYKNIDLPKVEWNQLFIDRIYAGLYLRMELPFDPTKKNGRTAPLREILSVSDTEMTAVDSRFNMNWDVYSSCISNGIFPELANQSEPVAWLAANRPTEEAIYILNGKEPFNVSPLPLPVSINTLFEEFNGTPLPAFHDERFERWDTGRKGDYLSLAKKLNSASNNRFSNSYAVYRNKFCNSLRTHLLANESSELISDWNRYSEAAGMVGIEIHGKKVICSDHTDMN